MSKAIKSTVKKTLQLLRSINPRSTRFTRQINTNAVAARNIANKPFSSSSTNIDVTQDDLNKARFVRFFAAIFMLTAGIRVAPNAAASTVDHTVKLLDAEERMLVSAGLSRLNMLLGMDAVKRRAVECGALPRLLVLINSAVKNGMKASGEAEDDIEMASRAVQAVVAMSEVPEGLAAIKQNSSSIVVLQRFVNSVPCIGGTEDALHAAKRLIVQACDQ
ncbi:hypothetical protein KSW81_000291 [Nannochloris sp. 'desiccata']|nr:hypothetical protein KSW81_000291 [Chlorella desiccata (nom. nud.)]